MVEYDNQKQKIDHDHATQKSGIKHNMGKTSSGKKGIPHSSEYAKLHYRDPDMQKLLVEGKGTTQAYNYNE